MDDIIEYVGKTADVVAEYTVHEEDIPYAVAEEIEMRLNTIYSRLLRLKYFYSDKGKKE